MSHEQHEMKLTSANSDSNLRDGVSNDDVIADHCCRQQIQTCANQSDAAEWIREEAMKKTQWELIVASMASQDVENETTVNTVQYSTVQCSTVQRKIQYSCPDGGEWDVNIHIQYLKN